MPVVATYVTDMRSAEFVFVHGCWRTCPSQPNTCLRQGCSLSPLTFRWVMADVADAKAEWDAAGIGFLMDMWVLRVLGWAADAWLVVMSRADLSAIVSEMRRKALEVVGLVPRFERCTWAPVPPTSTKRASCPRCSTFRRLRVSRSCCAHEGMWRACARVFVLRRCPPSRAPVWRRLGAWFAHEGGTTPTLCGRPLRGGMELGTKRGRKAIPTWTDPLTGTEVTVPKTPDTRNSNQCGLHYVFGGAVAAMVCNTEAGPDHCMNGFREVVQPTE